MNSMQILTAAHCTYGRRRSSFAVVPRLSYKGSFGGEPNTWPEKGYKVERIVNHEGFNETTMVNDIAIMTLTEPLNLSQPSSMELEASHHLPESKC